MRIIIRTSRLAIWSRRLGSFAIPLGVFPIFMHRAGTISSETFSLIETLAMSIALGAVLLALSSFIQLWYSGDKGWWRAVSGLIFGSLCLLPLVYMGVQPQTLSAIADVSTNPGKGITVISEATVIDDPGNIDQAEILEAFPGIVERNYPMNANRAYSLIAALVAERDWQIIRQTAPDLEQAEGQINAIDLTFLGWRDEVGIQVMNNAGTASVMMRSTSLGVNRDFGRNGRRIEKFLKDLDSAVTVALRNQPNLDGPPVPAVHTGE